MAQCVKKLTASAYFFVKSIKTASYTGIFMDQVTNNRLENQNRRGFLRQSLAAATAVGTATAGSNAIASALTAPIFDPDKTLRLVNAHTWEKLDIVYWSQGRYIDESLGLINHLMRDHRAGESIAMDVQLIDDLHRLYTLLDTSERIHILSGYRTKATNAKLRSRSNGVAKYSLHMEGRAIDLSVPGKSAKQVQNAAASMQAGGVGYYASSGFVHIDTGNVRRWSGS